MASVSLDTNCSLSIPKPDWIGDWIGALSEDPPPLETPGPDEAFPDVEVFSFSVSEIEIE